MLAQAMPMLYLATLYMASRIVCLRGSHRQSVVVDALFLNWTACTIADAIIGYPNNVAAYICIDMCSALWLSLKVDGTCSAIAGVFYIALIIFNSAFFFRHAFDPWTHWVGLSMLSWGQLLAVTGGSMRHDLAQAAGHMPIVYWVRRHLALGKKETSG